MKTKHFIALAICFFLSLVIFYGMGWIDGRKAMAKELILIKDRQDTTITNDFNDTLNKIEEWQEGVKSNKWYQQRHPGQKMIEI